MKIAPASVLLEISQGYVNHRENRENSWYWYSDGEKGGAIPFAASMLYRGQNSHHSPLLPSISRGLQSTHIATLFESSISDQAKIVLRSAQSWWFARELQWHPISHHAANQHVDLNEIALAQHYGIPTGYLDLSDDFNVSAFFATCQETENGWQPVDDGIGVIYRADLRKLGNFLDDYTPLGPQQLPRPSEQCAWVVGLCFGHGFEGWPGVELLPFHHDQSVGQHFLEMYDGGKLLFPADPLAEVAAEIISCGEIPIELVEATLEAFSNDPYGIRSHDLSAVRQKVSTLASQVSYRRLLTDQHIAPLLTDQEWHKKMLSPIKAWVRPVRRIKIT